MSLPRAPQAWLRASGWRHAFDGTAADAAILEALRGERRPAAGPVAVFGCGDGEWLLALAAEGIPSLGVDPSRPVLEEARARLARLPAGAPATELRHGDPRDLDTVRGASAVILAPPLLESLGTDEERTAVVRCAAESLGPGGLLVAGGDGRPPAAMAALDRPGAVDRGAVEDAVPPLRRETTVARDASGGRILRHRFRDASGMERASSGLFFTPVGLAAFRRIVAAAVPGAPPDDGGPADDAGGAWAMARRLG